MEVPNKVVKLLNGLLTTELRAINQYFLDSKLAAPCGIRPPRGALPARLVRGDA